MTIGILALQGDVREHVGAFGDLGVPTRTVRRPEDLADLAGIVLPGGESTTLSMLLESSGLFEPLGAALRAGLPAFGTCAGLLLLSGRIIDGRSDQRSFGVLDCEVRRNGYGRQRYSFESRLDASGVVAALGASPGGASPGGASPGGASPGDGSAGSGPGAPRGHAGGAPEETMAAVFIRAPVVVSVGAGVEVLATLETGADRSGELLAPDGTMDAPRVGERRSDPVVCRQGPVLASTFHPELTGERRLHLLFARMAGSLPGSRPGPP